MKIPFLSQRKNYPTKSSPSEIPLDPIEIVLHYHEQTKHHYHQFARSLGYLDWDTQPDPFRVFEGAPRIRLPLLPFRDRPFYDECFEKGRIAAEPLNETSLSRFLRHSLAISAWKRYQDSRWALRVNPSSGNLHPTEAYIVLERRVESMQAGVYHYCSRDHSLEQRSVFDSGEEPGSGFLVGLTSIHWREAWKYGERAYRYCQHDLGHALAALRISAALCGWRLTLLDSLSDEQISKMLGLDRPRDFHEAEDEFPAMIAAVEHRAESFSPVRWQGQANRLSVSHVEWEIINQVAGASVKPETPVTDGAFPDAFQAEGLRTALSAEALIQQRRSCLALDGETSIGKEEFFRMLSRVLPHSIPFDCLQQSVLAETFLHLAIFVHRVTGINPGLYMLVRNPEKLQLLQSELKQSFQWTPCSDRLPLYLLELGNFCGIASGISCGQDIAGDGAFSLGMIAEFEDPIRRIGPWLYRRLFWESGIIGQILYLEAEAAGIRSTGIGCFFDDPMHELLGINGSKFQTLYHFTVGGPVEDKRLTTEAPY